MCAAPGTVSWRREALTTLTKGKDEGQRNAAGLLERTCGPPAQCFKIEVDDQSGCERGSRAPTHLPRRFKNTAHAAVWFARLQASRLTGIDSAALGDHIRACRHQPGRGFFMEITLPVRTVTNLTASGTLVSRIRGDAV
jgi:hypothetical protein